MAWIRSNKRDITLDKLIDRSITEITSDVITVGRNAFSYCAQLIIADFPNATFISENAFIGCTSLRNVNIPNAITLDDAAFSECTTLQNINLSSATEIARIGLFNCSSLQFLDLPCVTHIGNQAVAGTQINILILRSTSMVILENDFTFTRTPFASGGSGGKLYVPQALISTYQNNTLWKQTISKNANNQILAIEGSPYEE